MCGIAVVEEVFVQIYFCGCFAQLKQVIIFSGSGYTDDWRDFCSANGEGNLLLPIAKHKGQ